MGVGCGRCGVCGRDDEGVNGGGVGLVGVHPTWVQYGHASPSSGGSGYTVPSWGLDVPLFLPDLSFAAFQLNSFEQNIGAILDVFFATFFFFSLSS